MLVRMYAEFETSNAFSALLDGLTGAIELISITLIWFVFFPPRFYRKFVSGSNVGESSGTES